MKRLDKYTDEELLALDGQQVQNLIDFECAHRGAPLLPESEPVAPEKPDIKEDVIYYSVKSGYQKVVSFDNRDAADLVVKTITESNDRVDAKYHTESKKNYVSPDDSDVLVVVEKGYSHDLLERHKVALAEYAKADAQYQEDLREWRRIKREREDTVNEVEERINEAYVRARERDRLRNTYDRYVKLVDGDERIALRFLRDAWSTPLSDKDLKEAGIPVAFAEEEQAPEPVVVDSDDLPF